MIPAVELDGVRHRYSSRDEDALAIERLSIGEGQRVALVGHSGSGKTTLLRVINGLVRPLTGRVCVLGTDLADPAARARAHRRRVGLVFQEFNLVERLSVYRNVLNGRPRRICRLGPWAAGGSRVLGSAISMHASFAGEVQWKPTVFQETTRLSTSVTLRSGLPLWPCRVGPLALSLAHRDIHGRLAEILNLGDEGRGTAMLVAGARNHRELTLLSVAV